MKRYRVCLMVREKYVVEVDAIDEADATKNALIDHSRDLSNFEAEDIDVESIEEIEGEE